MNEDKDLLRNGSGYIDKVACAAIKKTDEEDARFINYWRRYLLFVNCPISISRSEL